MKEVLRKGDLPTMADVLERGWQAKKRTSPAVSNQALERLYGRCRRAPWRARFRARGPAA